MINAWFDGVCEPKNPGGHGAYGIYIAAFDNVPVCSRGKYVGYGANISNNVAEYTGFIDILETLAAYNKKNIHIRGDSNLVIQQMSGNWRIKQGLYVPYALKAQKLLSKFRKVTLEWIPREENEICDKLAKDVLRNKNIVFRIQPEGQLCQK
uniref:Putative reverse transcriptase-like protein n=1 Tax=viral metagenome TaxID=1070528 RepID=A0A6M3KR87_9ZZZZ